jgi:hypothetical protein
VLPGPPTFHLSHVAKGHGPSTDLRRGCGWAAPAPRVRVWLGFGLRLGSGLAVRIRSFFLSFLLREEWLRFKGLRVQNVVFYKAWRFIFTIGDAFLYDWTKIFKIGQELKVGGPGST